MDIWISFVGGDVIRRYEPLNIHILDVINLVLDWFMNNTVVWTLYEHCTIVFTCNLDVESSTSTLTFGYIDVFEVYNYFGLIARVEHTWTYANWTLFVLHEHFTLVSWMNRHYTLVSWMNRWLNQVLLLFRAWCPRRSLRTTSLVIITCFQLITNVYTTVWHRFWLLNQLLARYLYDTTTISDLMPT